MQQQTNIATHGVPQRMRLISASSMFGPAPTPEIVVEQRLTLNAKGQVWYSTYTFAVPGGYQQLQMRRKKTDRLQAGEILRSIADFFSGYEEEPMICDGGDWHLELAFADGYIFKCHGPLCGEVPGELSGMLRSGLGMDYLWAFDQRGLAEDDVADCGGIKMIPPVPAKKEKH